MQFVILSIDPEHLLVRHFFKSDGLLMKHVPLTTEMIRVFFHKSGEFDPDLIPFMERKCLKLRHHLDASTQLRTEQQGEAVLVELQHTVIE